MKSIFRKIAFVLALAMIVTLFPVMNASAANNGNKYARTKDATLYVGGDANGDYEGCWAAQTKTKTWMKEEGYKSSYETSDDSVVTVSKYGYVEAVSVGKAEITATFSKKGEEDIVETFNVTVKKNAVSIALDKESQDALSAGLTAGDKVTLKAVQTDADGSNEGITDTVKFYCASKEDKEIIELNKDTGELTALKDGKATVVVQSCQYEYDRETKKYKTTVAAKAEYSVEVKEAGLVSVVQKTLDTFEVTTGTAEVAKAIIDAFTNSSKYSERLIVDRRISEQLIIKDLAIAEMKKKSDAEPNVIVVKMAGQIEANSTYVVHYNEDKQEFVGVEDKPASIEIITSEAQVQVEQKIEVLIRTKEGIDVTANHVGSSWIEAPASDDYYATSSSILFWEEGKSATVTAVYDMGWDLEKNVKIPDLKATKTIRSVKELASTNLVQGFAVSKKNNEDANKLAYTAGVIRLAVGDYRYLYAKYSTTQNGSESNQFLTWNNANEFTITSSNDHVVSVSGNVLYPQNAGSASITVKRGNRLIGVAYISVESGRNLDPATIDVQFNKRKLSSATGDSVVVTVKAKDQLGEDIVPIAKDFVVSNNKVSANSTKANEITLTAETGVTETVTVSMNISYGNVTRPYRFAISVKDVTNSSTVNYGVSVDRNELNAKLSETDKHTTNIKIAELDNEGFYIKDYTDIVTPINGLNGISKIDGKYVPGMYVQVSKGNDSFKDFVTNTTFDVLGKQTGVTVAAITTSGTAIDVSGIAPNGTYLVRVYYVDNNGNAPLLKGSTTFTVKDDTNLSVKVDSTKVKVDVSNNTIILDSLAKATKLKIDNVEKPWNGTTVTVGDITYRLEKYNLSNTSAVDSYFVTSIVVSVIKDNKCVQYTLPVNRLFTK